VRSAAIALLLCACGSEPGRRETPAPAPRADAGPAFARGEGVVVTISEIEERVRRTGESPSTAAEAILRDALLVAAAEKRGYGADTRRRVLVQKLLAEEVEAKVTAESIPRAEVEKAYQKRIDTYVHGERVRVEHFLARLEKRSPPEEIEKQRAIAERVYEAARAAPDAPLHTHRELAPREARVKVEELPAFGAGSVYDPNFAAAALALRTPGAISNVTRTPFGFHVIRLLERLPAESRRLAEVEAQLRAALLPEMRRRRLQELVADLGNRRRVTVDPAPLAALDR